MNDLDDIDPFAVGGLDTLPELVEGEIRTCSECGDEFEAIPRNKEICGKMDCIHSRDKKTREKVLASKGLLPQKKCKACDIRFRPDKTNAQTCCKREVCRLARKAKAGKSRRNRELGRPSEKGSMFNRSKEF